MVSHEIINTTQSGIQKLSETQNINYDNFIRQFNSYLSENSLPLNLESILSYIREAAEFYSISSMGVLKSAIKSGIRQTYLNQPYYLQFSHAVDAAFSQIKIGKTDPRISEERILEEHEIDILLSGGEYYDSKIEDTVFLAPDLDVFLVVQWLKETGMRISELITLELDSFRKMKKNYSEKSLKNIPAEFYQFSFIGKGKKERTNFILEEIYQETKDHYKGFTYLFEFNRTVKRYSFAEKEKIRKWISHQLNSYSKKVLGREINPHDFRHYFATRLLQEGKSLKSIAQWLGHSSTAITSDMYIHDELRPDDIY